MSVCDDVQSSLSAVLDGEDPVLDEAAVADHRSRCPSCDRFAAGLPALTRRARLSASPAVPDLRARIVAALAAGRATPPERGDARDVGWRRAVAALAGIVQLVVAVPTFLGAPDAGHLAHDLAASEAALAAVFLLAAWRPVQARALAVVASLFAAVGGLAAIAAVLEGGTVSAEVTHLVPIVGAVVLWSLVPRPGGPDGGATRTLVGHR